MATKNTKPTTSPAAASEKKAPKAVKVSSEPGKIETAMEFFDESKAELKKVTWPTKKEVRVTTLAVLILVVVMSIFLGVLDIGLVTAVEAITNIGR